MYRFLLSCLAGACLLAACQSDPPARQEPPHMPRGPYATRLRFDPRYHDSIMGPPPYSQATLRQRMILDQLTRLRWVRQGDSLGTCAARPDTAQVRQRTGGEAVLLPSGRFAWDTAARYTFYPNCAAELARIRRVVRVLEAQERTAPVRASKRLASGYSAPQAHPPRVHLLQTNARDMVARYGCRIGELTVTALYQQHAETGDIAGSPAIVVQQRAPGPAGTSSARREYGGARRLPLQAAPTHGFQRGPRRQAELRDVRNSESQG